MDAWCTMASKEDTMRTYLYLVLLILFTGLSSAQAQVADSTSTSSLRFLALGDSYTIGESVSPSDRWPVQLADTLRSLGIDIANPTILATTGWTTLDLMDALFRADLNPPYDMVSLLIGVNDQYQGKDIADYPSNFRYLLESAVRLAGQKPGRVVVLSIPDYGVTSFGQQKNPEKIARELDRYNAINRSIADSMDVHYVDITPGSRKALTDTTLIADDRLHPSARMYRQWVEKVVPVILPELKQIPKNSPAIRP